MIKALCYILLGKSSLAKSWESKCHMWCLSDTVDKGCVSETMDDKAVWMFTKFFVK